MDFLRKNVGSTKHIKMLPKFHGLFTQKCWINKKYEKCYQNITDYLRAIVRSIKNIKSLTVEHNILADKIC